MTLKLLWISCIFTTLLFAYLIKIEMNSTTANGHHLTEIKELPPEIKKIDPKILQNAQQTLYVKKMQDQSRKISGTPLPVREYSLHIHFNDLLRNDTEAQSLSEVDREIMAEINSN